MNKPKYVVNDLDSFKKAEIDAIGEANYLKVMNSTVMWFSIATMLTLCPIVIGLVTVISGIVLFLVTHLQKMLLISVIGCLTILTGTLLLTVLLQRTDTGLFVAVDKYMDREGIKHSPIFGTYYNKLRNNLSSLTSMYIFMSKHPGSKAYRGDREGSIAVSYKTGTEEDKQFFMFTPWLVEKILNSETPDFTCLDAEITCLLSHS